MDWTSFGAGLLVGLAAWTPLMMLLAWRLRGVGANQVPILERVQRALLDKIGEIPADELDRVREYIHEIKRLQPDSPAAERAAASSERGGAAQTMNLLKALVRSKADDPVRQRLVRYTADPRSARLAAQPVPVRR